VTRESFEAALRELDIYPGKEDFENLWRQYCKNEDVGVYFPQILKRFTVPDQKPLIPLVPPSATPRGRRSHASNSSLSSTVSLVLYPDPDYKGRIIRKGLKSTALSLPTSRHILKEQMIPTREALAVHKTALKGCGQQLVCKFARVDIKGTGYVPQLLFFEEIHKKGILITPEQKMQIMANHGNHEGRVRYKEFSKVFDFMADDDNGIPLIGSSALAGNGRDDVKQTFREMAVLETFD